MTGQLHHGLGHDRFGSRKQKSPRINKEPEAAAPIRFRASTWSAVLAPRRMRSGHPKAQEGTGRPLSPPTVPGINEVTPLRRGAGGRLANVGAARLSSRPQEPAPGAASASRQPNASGRRPYCDADTTEHTRATTRGDNSARPIHRTPQLPYDPPNAARRTSVARSAVGEVCWMHAPPNGAGPAVAGRSPEAAADPARRAGLVQASSWLGRARKGFDSLAPCVP
jgi:hypothetical protein